MHTKYILPGKDHLKLCPVPLLSVYMRCVCVWCVCGVCVCVRSMCMSICKCACLSDSVPTKVFICILFIIICNGDQESITSTSVMVSLY